MSSDEMSIEYLGSQRKRSAATRELFGDIFHSRFLSFVAPVLGLGSSSWNVSCDLMNPIPCTTRVLFNFVLLWSLLPGVLDLVGNLLPSKKRRPARFGLFDVFGDVNPSVWSLPGATYLRILSLKDRVAPRGRRTRGTSQQHSLCHPCHVSSGGFESG